MSSFRAQPGQALDDNTIMRFAPSIFVHLKHPKQSESYRHVPTFEVLNRLRDNGFSPVCVAQSGSGEADTIRGLFAHHSIRFRKTESLARNEMIPELLLRNAHDGTGSYEISAGLYRTLCLNSLIAGHLFRVTVRHSGNVDLVSRVLAASDKIIASLPDIFNRVDQMHKQILDEPRRLNFAKAALKLVPTKLKFDASELLTPRRGSDLGHDAWTTLNVVQENVIRGGIEALDRNGSTRRTASIKDVERDAIINRELWDLAEAA